MNEIKGCGQKLTKPTETMQITELTMTRAVHPQGYPQHMWTCQISQCSWLPCEHQSKIRGRTAAKWLYVAPQQNRKAIVELPASPQCVCSDTVQTTRDSLTAPKRYRPDGDGDSECAYAGVACEVDSKFVFDLEGTHDPIPARLLPVVVRPPCTGGDTRGRSRHACLPPLRVDNLRVRRIGRTIRAMF